MSEKSLSSKVTLHPSSATKIHVSTIFLVSLINISNIIAGLTVGDPILRTGAPLCVELGPGK